MRYSISLIAAFLPFILWPVEILLPYPYLVEEVAKAFFVLFTVNNIASSQVEPPPRAVYIKSILVSAFTFSLSETVLYILNISLNGDLFTLITRLILTTTLHSLTMIIMLLSVLRSKWLIVAGVGLAALIHHLYNLAIKGIS